MPNYLYRRKYGLSVRLRVPKDLAPWFSVRAEIRLSIKTTNPKKAAERARLIVGYIQWIFRDIRLGGKIAELAETEMDKLLRPIGMNAVASGSQGQGHPISQPLITSLTTSGLTLQHPRSIITR